MYSNLLKLLQLKHPDWFGIVSRNTCCCIRNETIVCKPGREADTKCVLVDTKVEVSSLKILAKVTSSIIPEELFGALGFCTLAKHMNVHI